jgi:Fic family protein
MDNLMGMINLSTISITPEVLSLIAEIDEFKGAWQALGRLAPEQLSALKKVATIESIGSSTRIEGARLSDQEVERLLGKLSLKSFGTRDEQEVAGYADVMNLIFESYEHLNLTESHIQQLHRDILKYSEKDDWHRGRYKKSTNHVEAFDKDGNRLGVVFETASPFETPMKMEELARWASDAFEQKELHPLLIIALFIVVFLAIHPFQDGNGRLSRALTNLLLLRSGYLYAPYSSLEAVIEQNKDRYYLALRKTQGSLKGETPDWTPWIIFFLKALQQQKSRLQINLEREQLLLGQLPELSLQIIELTKSRGRVTIRDIVTLTSANRNTIKKHLERLVADRYLGQHGIGRGVWYSQFVEALQKE